MKSNKLGFETTYLVSSVKKLYDRDLIEINDLRFFQPQLKNISNFGSGITVSEKHYLYGNLLRFVYRKISNQRSTFNLAKIVFKSLPLWMKKRIQKELFYSEQRSLTIEPALDFDLGFGIDTSEKPIVSIVIPVYNGWYVTVRCLRAIQSCLDRVKFEVIVVDDESNDETSSILKNIRGIKVVTLSSNVGYLRATNIGAEQAIGEYILLLNNDTEPTSGWMDSLLDTLESNPNAVIAGSSLVYPTRTLQEAGSQIFENGKAIPVGRGKSPLRGEYLFRKQVDFCSAASILIRTSFWRDNHGFDIRFAPAYCEDCDLSLLAWSQGKEVLHDPFSLVYHHESGSHGEAAGGLIHENTKKLVEKWKRDLLWHWDYSGEVRNEHLRDSKGIIVVIDYRLPSELKDSGSIRTIRLAKLLKDSGYHVIVGSLDRMTTFADINNLRRDGVEVHLDVKELYESLKDRSSRVKCFWIIREYVFNQVIEDIRRINPNAFVINDLLDLNYNIKEASIKINKHQIVALNRSDLTVLVSPHESRILAKANPKIRVFDIWKPFPLVASDKNFSEREKVVFVGGFRHLPNLEGIFWFTDNVYPRIKERLNLSVQVVGTGLTKEQTEYLVSSGLEVIGGVENLDEIYEAARVVIVPLQTGAGMKGKLAEALAYGVPVVTTTIGAEGYDFQTSDMVEIVDSPIDFGNSILTLATDEIRFKEASEAAYSYINKNHSYSAVSEKLKTIIGEIEKLRH